MPNYAPYDYIEKYFSNAINKNELFPSESKFWQSNLRKINSKKVLNAGCGPMFYDDVQYFSGMPEEYIGNDLNKSNTDFLLQSRKAQFIDSKNFAENAINNIKIINGDFRMLVDNYNNYFDQVLGIGFYGIFTGSLFDEMVAATNKVLKSNGRLLTVTWHGPKRTQKTTEEKVAYKFDGSENLSPAAFVAGINAAGFETHTEEYMNSTHDAYGWEQIQICEFVKTKDFNNTEGMQ